MDLSVIIQLMCQCGTCIQLFLVKAAQQNSDTKQSTVEHIETL